MSVFDGERHVAEAIQSILTQSWEDFEFIIVEDGSTDRSGEVIDSFRDDRIKVVRNRRNIGLTRSLNKGISLAKGKYIARMDADDVSLPRRLEKQLTFIEASGVSLVIAKAVYFDEQGQIVWFPTEKLDTSDLVALLFMKNCVAHDAVLFKREDFLSLGGYDERYRVAQDFELYHGFLDRFSISLMDEVLCHIRMRSTGISKTRKAEQDYYVCLTLFRAIASQMLKTVRGESNLHLSLSFLTYCLIRACGKFLRRAAAPRLRNVLMGEGRGLGIVGISY